mmetsp:Transcript_69399/g.136189  ORF Transcript_69399/g.136189 Transcript_69399/m.136189 type:complete len:200 (-) Transcript_69399:630-1229(-)
MYFSGKQGPFHLIRPSAGNSPMAALLATKEGSFSSRSLCACSGCDMMDLIAASARWNSRCCFLAKSTFKFLFLWMRRWESICRCRICSPRSRWMRLRRADKAFSCCRVVRSSARLAESFCMDALLAISHSSRWSPASLTFQASSYLPNFASASCFRRNSSSSRENLQRVGWVRSFSWNAANSAECCSFSRSRLMYAVAS